MMSLGGSPPALARLKGEDGMVCAAAMTRSTAPLVAAETAGRIVAVTVEPPEVGPSGSELSPRTTSILSMGMPVFSETTWAKTV